MVDRKIESFRNINHPSQENLIKLEFSSFAGNALSASANMFHIPCVETIMDLLHFAFYRKIIVKGFLFNVHHE